jgi:hypothetical protein
MDTPGGSMKKKDRTATPRDGSPDGIPEAQGAEARGEQHRSEREGSGGNRPGGPPARKDTVGKLFNIDDFRLPSWKNSESYRSALNSVLERLAETSSDILSTCFGMAVAGTWREWDATVPVGTEIAVDDEMLMDTGDTTITALIKLKKRIDDFLFLCSIDDTHRSSPHGLHTGEIKLDEVDTPHFPWDDVKACCDHVLDAEGYKDRKPCPKCGTRPEKLIWISFMSPLWTWQQLCGQQGPLSICPKCTIQVEFILNAMN